MGLHLIVFGGPGAGKGTQAIRLARARKIPHISTGDIFRQHIEQGTALGRQIQADITAGHLAQDEVACAIVAQRLTEGDCRAGYILDGFPRSVAQAQGFDEILKHRGEELDLVINLQVDDEEIVARLSSRRVCHSCGAIFNLRFNPVLDDDHCEAAENGAHDLMHRPDDEEETIRERLRIYYKTSEPVLAYYAQSGKLRHVAGMGSTPDDVFHKIESVIDAFEAACLS
ncbi:MAG: adenylate kinase [Candidatus Hydrogenedentes bacterium]|nr:adenylate kinase [Candidatus Hydrogenedentota bacterium]